MKKICKNCGFSDNPIDAVFCGYCGSKFHKDIDLSPSQWDKDEKIQLAINNVLSPQKKVGKNDPCPCGSGRKYKNCHGRNIV